MNMKRQRTEDINSLDLDEFHRFFLQAAHNIYYCKQNKVQMPVIE